MLFVSMLAIAVLTSEPFSSPAPTICQSLPDLSTVTSDLSLPLLSSRSKTGRVTPGTRSIVRLGGVWADRPAYFVLYVPPQITSETKLPLVVDLPGNGGYHNGFGDVCTGKPENQSFGYGLTRGKDALVASVPFLHDNYSLAHTWLVDCRSLACLRISVCFYSFGSFACFCCCCFFLVPVIPPSSAFYRHISIIHWIDSNVACLSASTTPFSLIHGLSMTPLRLICVHKGTFSLDLKPQLV